MGGMTRPDTPSAAQRAASHAEICVAVMVAMVPLAWALGLDQALWLAAGLGLGAAAAFRQGDRTGLAPIGGLFVATVVVSGVLGAQGERWLTFLRWVLIVTAFFAAVLGARTVVAHPGRVSPLLVALTATVSVSGFLSLIAFGLQQSFSFATPIAPLVPDSIASTPLGAASFTTRSLAAPSYFLGADFLRPRGLFLFSTTQALAQAAAVPLVLAMTRWWPSLRPWLVTASVCMALSLLATTARASILALAIGLFVVWFARKASLNARSAILAGLLVALGATVFMAAGWASSAFELLGTRSWETRSSLYAATIDRWTERPLLGWGTEVDRLPAPTPAKTPDPQQQRGPTAEQAPETQSSLEGTPPLGSHSQYLGVLFKQGVIGLALFATALVVVSRAAVLVFIRRPPGGDFVVAAFLVSLLVSVTEEIWLDPGSALVIACVWGVNLGLGLPSRSWDEPACGPATHEGAPDDAVRAEVRPVATSQPKSDENAPAVGG